MSAETESIVLGVIALFAAVGTAVAIRRKTAKAAVACCIVGGGVLLLYGNLDHEAKRDAERQAQWQERQQHWRAVNPNEKADPQMIVSPNGSGRRSNESDVGIGGGGRNSGGVSIGNGMRPIPGAVGAEGFRQGIPSRRRLPMRDFVPERLPGPEEQPERSRDGP